MSTIVSDSQGFPAPKYRLDVEAFSLFGSSPERGNHVHYRADGDLMGACKPAGQGTVAGLVLVELGIDGYETHQVRVDLCPIPEDPEAYQYHGDRVAALDDAMEALDAIRDQLDALRTVEEMRAHERTAFELGTDAQRLGLVGSGSDAVEGQRSE